jgi:tRNA A37 threonylcarbamoyladenosine synthetase subunit TsaC/SUA5/YrdC
LRYWSYGITPTVWEPKKSRYQSASSPISTGRLAASGAVRKCSSIAWNPASISSNWSGPIAIIVDSPMAESIEYRPPTQSQNPNMLAVSMPNADTFSALVDTATKWFATASGDPSADTIHSLADSALVSVSSVPNVFEEMMNRVSSGDRSRTASTKSVESTLDTKRNVIERSL